MATFEIGKVTIDQLTEPIGGPSSLFGDIISAPGIDAYGATSFTIGGINATAINIGHSGLSTFIYGSSLFIGQNIDTIGAGAMDIGGANATGINIGHSTISILPGADNTQSFGNSSFRWKDGYFGGKLVLDGYSLDLSAGAITGQALVYNGSAFIAQTVSGSSTVTDQANVTEFLLSTTSPTTVATYTGSSGNYIIYVYYRVFTATTDLTLTLTWTDATGAQSQDIITPVTSTPVGSYTLAPFYINATAAAITLTGTAGTASQVRFSANIVGMS